MAEDQPTKSKRRVVKNPETFREKALKATEAANQPKKRGRISLAFIQLLVSVLRPIGRILKAIFTSAPFRLLGKILRPLGKVLFLPYFVSSWKELKQVTWPNWRESRQLTMAVLVFAVIFGAAIAGVDYGLDKVFRNVLLK